MKISSAQFRQNNTITHRANMGLFLDTDVMKQGGHYGVWQSDSYIDQNQNGKVDVSVQKTGGFLKSVQTTTIEDPVLCGGRRPLRDSAETAGGSEVICLENSREHFVEDVDCHTQFNLFGYQGETFERTNQRSLSQLAREISDSENAQWAVDFKTGEFLVYEAKP
jgi:hypothetical protein